MSDFLFTQPGTMARHDAHMRRASMPNRTTSKGYRLRKAPRRLTPSVLKAIRRRTRQLEASARPTLDAIQKSEQITERDLAIRINARG